MNWYQRSRRGDPAGALHERYKTVPETLGACVAGDSPGLLGARQAVATLAARAAQWRSIARRETTVRRLHR